jgi:RimJ/RimL family protein N-acetyltransferase
MFPVEGRYEEVELRDLEPGDEPALEALHSDMGAPPTGSASGSGWLSHAETTSTVVPRDDYILAIDVGGELTGIARLQVDSRADGRGEIGYAVRRNFRGKGYASRAVMALAGVGFGIVGLHRLWAVCDVENQASVGVLTRAGFIQEGVLKDDRWDGEHWRDSLIFARLEGEPGD